PYQLFRHTLGAKKDELVYEEKDELYRVRVKRTRDKAYLLALSWSSTTTETRFLPSGEGEGKWRVFLPREEEHRYYVDHRAGLFYIRTNKDAKNFRLVTAPADDLSAKNWKEMIAHRPKVLLQGIDLFQHHCVVQERENGLEQLRVIDLHNGKEHRLEVKEPGYSASASATPE